MSVHPRTLLVVLWSVALILGVTIACRAAWLSAVALGRGVASTAGAALVAYAAAAYLAAVSVRGLRDALLR